MPVFSEAAVRRPRLSAFQWALLAPGAVLLLVLLAAPIALMAVESFHPFVAGTVGSSAGWTLRNYTELIEPARRLLGTHELRRA